MSDDGPDKTTSETLFEQYLGANAYSGWDFEPEIAGQTRRPDYRLPWDGLDVLLEVKELHQDQPPPRGAYSVDPYKGLREKINAARRKFRQVKAWCCCLVVCNIDDWKTSLDPLHVYGAMLGDLGFTFDFHRDQGYVDGSERGAFLSRGKMIRDKTREPQNTTTRALIVLEAFRADEPAFRQKVNDALAQEADRKGAPLAPDEAAIVAVNMHLKLRPQHFTVPRVRVMGNPSAKEPHLPDTLFRGPYDERWVYDGEVRRVYAGPERGTRAAKVCRCPITPAGPAAGAGQ